MNHLSLPIGAVTSRAIGPTHEFFRELLRGKQTPTPLPCAEPASRLLARVGLGESSTVVDRAIAHGVYDLARWTRTTPATVVQAAWALVLAHFTGDRDVLFGSTRSCQRPTLGGDAGPMARPSVNTLPLRVRIEDGDTVSALLAALHSAEVEMRPHEHTSRFEVHAQSEIPEGTPLFETVLVFESRDPRRTLGAGGERDWETTTLTLDEQPAAPLTVVVVDDGGFEIRLFFDRRLFRDSAVDRLAASFVAALQALARDAARCVAEIDLLPAAERHRLLVAWNDTARPFPDDQCIHEPFEQRVRLDPGAVAVEMAGSSLSYEALDRRANQLAHALRAQGARPGTFVGICVDRGLDLVVALLGVAKSGAAYLPLDPAHPKERLAFILADAAALLVVTQERYRLALPLALITLDGAGAAALAEMPASRLPRTAHPTDLCYAIFTSGSTGTPKGVALSHRAVANTLDWVNRTFGVGPGDRLLFVTSPCFDLSVYDTFGALGAGATVVIASGAVLDDPAALVTAIVEQRITIWDSAPAALLRLVPFFPRASRDAPLRLVLLSGDWIALTLPDAVRDAFPRARVVSLGGATEAAIWSNWFPIGAVDPRWTSVPYGRPIQNARYHVLDRQMRPVPVGVTGDLYIGGACLAEGYLNRPQLTAERFVRDPFRGDPAERLYKTGDLARYFDDGVLELRGRVDFQVKIRGYRVELGEVEAALAGTSGVRETICVARADASGEKSIVAYVVAREGGSLEEEALKEAVRRKLPAYMVPSQVMILDALPLSSNGKVDRGALPSVDTRATSKAGVGPRTELERKMVEIWEELLRHKPIGVTDSFFALGGHSLLAVTMVTRVRERLGLQVPLSSVLQWPTIATLVAAIEARPRGPRRVCHLVTMNGEGTRPPLVLVPGIGGYCFAFQGLSALFGAEQPVHMLHAIGAEDGAAIEEHTIEELAEIYEPEILAVCSRGPVVLGGYSFGALLAFELAHRLRSRGRPVPLLVSFDGFAPGFPSLLPWPERLMAHAKELARGGPMERRAYLRARLENLRARVFERRGRPEEALARIPDADPDLDERMRRVVALLWHARNLYRPERMDPCALLLLKTNLATPWLANRMDDPLYGWSSFIRGPLDVEVLPGDHYTLFQPTNLPRIAEFIARHITQLEGAAAAGG
jgi:amino acid adenylation domain-containing protein